MPPDASITAADTLAAGRQLCRVRDAVGADAGPSCWSARPLLQIQALPEPLPPPLAGTPHHRRPTPPPAHLVVHVGEGGEKGDEHSLDHLLFGQVPSPPAQLHIEVPCECGAEGLGGLVGG